MPTEIPEATQVEIEAAAFRRLVQHFRERTDVQNIDVMNLAGFFGCDHPDVDLLYRDELEQWQRDGVVTVLPAFFRKPDGDVLFVQHRLWKERERVRALLDRGAVVFVCGDGVNMAPAVRETFGRIYQESAGCSADEATQWVSALEKQGRYVADVFA